MQGSFAEALRAFALSFPEAHEAFSFGPDHAVFKAANGKMFAIASESAEATSVSLKLTPEESEAALMLPFVRPAPYMARNHWVLATIRNEAECEMTLDWITRSHELVTTRPARKKRQ